ncbi:DUF397 domain-containing protein [Streptomyces sp. ODS28]|uniref:DUF397 domain-containing protein n=1 Tax=Streptomyces sp. ODS28 TaxID=3136688 RepID=UPI0031EA53FD
MQFDNGVAASMIPGVSWSKSTASVRDGNCVEVAELPDGRIAVRNSRFPDGPALIYSREEVAAFVTGVKDEEFDHLIS